MTTNLYSVNTQTGCWEWGGPIQKRQGYGVKWVGRSYRMAHRWMYENLRGPVPDGLVLDHLCRNTQCVNPDHLEPVTDRVNILRGVGPTAVNATKTQCANGHEFTPKNTRTRPDGSRRCRTCEAGWDRGRARPDRVGVRTDCSVCGKRISKGNYRQHLRNMHREAAA